MMEETKKGALLKKSLNFGDGLKKQSQFLLLDSIKKVHLRCQPNHFEELHRLIPFHF